MKQVFDFQESHYNICFETRLLRWENKKTAHYGIQSIKFLGTKIRAMIIPQNIKNCKYLQNLRD